MTTATLLKTTYAPHAIDEEALDQLFRAARTHNRKLPSVFRL